MAMTDAERVYISTRELLGREKNKEKVVRILMSRGANAVSASEMVDTVFGDIQSHNRRASIGKIIMSGLGLLVFGGIFIFTGHLFFIILPLAGVGFLWGIITFLTASGYELVVEDASDD